MFLGNSRVVLNGLYEEYFLYAGGTFSSADNLSTENIAKWSEVRWAKLAEDQTFNGDVRAIKFNFASSGTKMYVGGEFTEINGEKFNYIAMWDGDNWNKITENGYTGFNGPVYALESFKGDMYFGGSFTAACGMTSNRITRWKKSTASFDSSWMGIGTTSGLNGTVRAIAIGPPAPFDYDTIGSNNYVIYFGGSFTAANDGTIAPAMIQRYNNTWHNPRQFLGPYPQSDVINTICIRRVGTLGEENGTVFVGGTFSGVSDLTFYSYSSSNIGIYYGGLIAELDPVWNQAKTVSLEGLTFNGEIFSIVFRYPQTGGTTGDIFIGGNFTQVLGAGIPGNIANNIVKFSLSDGAISVLTSNGETGTDGPVYTIAIDNSDNVYVGGGFTHAGGTSANRIAMWDGSTWNPLKSGMNDDVYSIELDPKSKRGRGWGGGGGGYGWGGTPFGDAGPSVG